MTTTVTRLLLLVGLAVAPAARAADLTYKTPRPAPTKIGAGISTFGQCDNGVLNSAFFEHDDRRYGNSFNFPSGSWLSYVQFAHHGWQTLHGPYDYDIELWDQASCTMVGAANGLTAADAYDSDQVELVNVCAEQIVLSGDVIVAINPNSCFTPSDCYPDLYFDDQLEVACPWVVDATTGQCTDVSPDGGPFVLRVGYNSCTGGVESASDPERAVRIAVLESASRPVRMAVTLGGTGSREVAVDVYDISGRRVRALLRGELAAGRHTLEWDGRSDAGDSVGTGVYLVRLRAGTERASATVVLLK